MKRVKKGFVAEFCDRQQPAHKLRFAEDGGELCVSIRDKEGKIRHFTMAPDQCESAGIIGVLEEVPERWERVRDAVFNSADLLEGEGARRHRMHMSERGWRRVVELLDATEDS